MLWRRKRRKSPNSVQVDLKGEPAGWPAPPVEAPLGELPRKVRLAAAVWIALGTMIAVAIWQRGEQFEADMLAEFEEQERLKAESYAHDVSHRELLVASELEAEAEATIEKSLDSEYDAPLIPQDSLVLPDVLASCVRQLLGMDDLQRRARAVMSLKRNVAGLGSAAIHSIATALGETSDPRQRVLLLGLTRGFDDPRILGKARDSFFGAVDAEERLAAAVVLLASGEPESMAMVVHGPRVREQEGYESRLVREVARTGELPEAALGKFSTSASATTRIATVEVLDPLRASDLQRLLELATSDASPWARAAAVRRMVKNEAAARREDFEQLLQNESDPMVVGLLENVLARHAGDVRQGAH